MYMKKKYRTYLLIGLTLLLIAITTNFIVIETKSDINVGNMAVFYIYGLLFLYVVGTIVLLIGVYKMFTDKDFSDSKLGRFIVAFYKVLLKYLGYKGDK